VSRRLSTATFPVALGLLIALSSGAIAPADASTVTGAGASTTTPAASSGSTAPPEPASSSSQTASPSVTAATPTTSTTTSPGAAGTTTTEASGAAPEVQAQRPQPRSVAPEPRKSGAAGGAPPTGPPAGSRSSAAPPVSTVAVPPPPGAFGTSVSGVPSFFIDSFSIPPFLLPIYQSAGAAYGIPWQVLAAINEVETDYGRDLSVSSAGAEGWMQFLPGTWGSYGIDANNSGVADPYNPADAIFAAARYLRDAGGAADIRAAVFAYNHSRAYVNSVMLRARLLTGTPPALLGSMTALAEARFPVHAPSHFSDGFPMTEGPSPHPIPATTIYSRAGAPVIAVQDGRIAQIGDSPAFGRHISLTDAHGNTYTYAELGALSSRYPVLDGHGRFSLHPLRAGVSVIAGTVLGHLGSSEQPHVLFQIRPAGAGAQPILDNWVKLRYSATVLAPGRDPYKSLSKRGLLALPGAVRPLQIGGPARILKVRRRAGSRHPKRGHGPGAARPARTAAFFGLGLSPAQWLALIARLGQIPDPEVAHKPSPAAIPDNAGVSGIGGTH